MDWSTILSDARSTRNLVISASIRPWRQQFTIDDVCEKPALILTGLLRDGGGAISGSSKRRDSLSVLLRLAFGFGGVNHFANARLYFGTPARAVEHAVMADTRLHIMVTVIFRNVAA